MSTKLPPPITNSSLEGQRKARRALLFQRACLMQKWRLFSRRSEPASHTASHTVCAPSRSPENPEISTGTKSPALICCSNKSQTEDCAERALSHYAPHETARQQNHTPTQPHAGACGPVWNRWAIRIFRWLNNLKWRNRSPATRWVGLLYIHLF